MGLLKSCLLCSLKTGCFMVAFYTFLLAGLLLLFNIHDLVNAPDYIVWTRIVSFVFAILLFFAGLVLVIGLFRKAPGMLGFWMGVFTLFIIYQIAMVCWDIYYYTNMETKYNNVSTSMYVNMIIFGILIFGDIIALVAVHSYRDHLGGRGLQPVPIMA